MIPERTECGVVIVAYNSAATIRACIESILASPPARPIVVVDNASVDGTLPAIRGMGDRVEIIENGTNAGFAVAANLGASRIDAPFIAFVNPDAVAGAGCLEILIEELRQSPPSVWAVGPALLNDDGEREYSARGFPSKWSGLVNRRWHSAFPRSRNREIRRFLMLDRDRHDAFEADWLSGAFIVVRKSVFEELGRFDPSFFLFYEEIDLFRRARSRGYAARFVGRAVATHSIGGSAKTVSARAAIWRVKSLRRYFAKHVRRNISDDVVFWSATVLGITLEAASALKKRITASPAG